MKSGGGEPFEDPEDGEVVFAGEVDAGEEFRSAAVVRKDGGAEGLRGRCFGGECGFARFDKVVREEDFGVVSEFAEILLRPGFRVGQAGLEFGGIERQAGGNGVVDGELGFEVCRDRSGRMGQVGGIFH